MQESENKIEIIETRKGGLGSSDADMVLRVAKSGIISDSAKQRLAIMLEYEQQKTFKTASTQLGNRIEDALFSSIKTKFPNAVSNPYSERTDLSSKYGFRVFNHIDFEIVDDKFLTWMECKATNHGDVNKVIKKYENQLQWHWMILVEKAKELGLKPRLFIVYFDTNTIGDEAIEFNDDNIIIKPVACMGGVIKTFETGLKLISKEVKSFQYEPLDELSAYNLPTAQQDYISDIGLCLQEIAERNVKVNEFKEKMLALMIENGVKSIKTDTFSISVVSESVSTSVDTSELKEKHPKIYKKVLKLSKRKAYLKITLKD